MITAAMLTLITEAGEGVLVLADGLEESDFRRSRLTRAEICHQLRLMAETLDSLPEATQQAMPEVDWGGWRATALALGAGAAANDGAAWFAVRSLVPATLSWLRLYRRSTPALFAFRP